MEVRGKEQLERALQEETVTKPVGGGIRDIVLWLQSHVVKSEPVRTSRLRSSVTTQLDEPRFYGKIDTSVSYAPFVEYGHVSRGGTFVPPSRVRHGTSIRVRDKGAFTYAMQEAKNKIGDWLKGLGASITERFDHGT